MDGVRIIDGDGHIFEDADGISAFLPSPYRERGTWPMGRLMPPNDHFHYYVGETPPGSFCRDTGPPEWLAFLDEIGLDGAVLYPSSGLAYGKITSRDWAIAYAQAYNDWLADAYLRRSPRLEGMALIPMQEPAAAVVELRRAVEVLGMRGAMLPSTGFKAHLGSKEYWPVYEEADRLGCCLAVHGGAHSGLGMDDMNVYTPVPALGHPFSLLINFAGIVFNGVLERYPNARFAFLEGGVAWLLLALERFDRTHETHIQFDPRGDLLGPRPGQKASAYVLEQIAAGRLFVGCEGSEPLLPHAVQVVGNAPFMYSSDFPHEVSPAMCRAELDELLAQDALTAADKAAILYGNAERFYGLARGAPRADTTRAGSVAG
jgi:uncharacterized protein